MMEQNIAAIENSSKNFTEFWHEICILLNHVGGGFMPKGNFINKIAENIDATVDLMVDQVTSEENKELFADLSIPSTKLPEIREHLRHELEGFKDQFLQGYKLVLDAAIKKHFSIPVEKFEIKPVSWEKHPDWENLSDEQLLKLINKSILLQELCEYTPEMMRMCYELALDFYHNKEWDKCSEVCVFLATLNPTVYGFWQLLGRSLEEKRDFERALVVFEIGINCNLQDINSYREAIRCCIAADFLDEAMRLIDFGFKVVEVNAHPANLSAFKRELEALKVHVNKLVRR